MLPASGSIQGRALVDGAPARGLTVNISGGELNETTAVISQGPAAGTYSFFNLPAPRTYTLTFSGDGTIPQVRVVDLDPSSSTENQTGIDVSLAAERTTVFGVVLDVDGSLASQANVLLTNGADEWSALTSDEPSVGRFEFSGIEPGAYTLTASRVGTIAVVNLVNVSATQPTPEIRVQLGQQASLAGRIVAADVATRQYTVRLYRPDLFPFEAERSTTTDTSGNYTFPALDAPESYVVGVFGSAAGGNVLDSIVVRTQPGVVTPVPDISIGAP